MIKIIVFMFKLKLVVLFLFQICRSSPIENCLLYKPNGECYECSLAEKRMQCNPCIVIGCEECT